MKTKTAETIIVIITRKGRVRPDELKKTLKLTAAAIHRQLNKLVSQGRLAKQGTPPRVFYVLAKAEAQQASVTSMPGYLLGLDRDLQKSLSEQLQTLWAHNSTALEGNSLTLGETHQVLSAGLTINGKPLADHNEVLGHARAEGFLNLRGKCLRS